MTTSSQYSQHVVFRHGRSLLIRAIRPDDKQRLLDGFHRLTGESVYCRFFSGKQELSEKELRYFTEIDFEHHVAIVATIMSEDKEEIIAVGRYIETRSKGPERAAELAFTVADEYQNLGIGTLLFNQVLAVAQNNGISQLEADVLLENKAMLVIFKHCGFKLKTTKKNSMVHIEFIVTAQQHGKI